MLRIHILNVGQGDSIIIEHTDKAGKKFFGVIDSNKQKNETSPKALKKLISLGAKRLSFVCLTHPHSDHYLGLLQILDHFHKKIDRLWTCPLDDYVGGNLKRLSKVYIDLVKSSLDNQELRDSIVELVRIFKHIDENYLKSWDQLCGGYSLLNPVGFLDVDFYSILPLCRSKSVLATWIRDGQPRFPEQKVQNRLSVAILLKYCGISIVLGGDALSVEWNAHKKQFLSKNLGKSQIVKLPHHGSKLDCNESVIQYLFDSSEQKYALISADGNSHPDQETILSLKAKNIKPYCTNLKDICGNNVSSLSVVPDGIDRDFHRKMNEVREEKVRVTPCQGDITVDVIPDGVGGASIQVLSETENACPYH